MPAMVPTFAIGAVLMLVAALLLLVNGAWLPAGFALGVALVEVYCARWAYHRLR
jgi:type IV secretory pathway TrbD component